MKTKRYLFLLAFLFLLSNMAKAQTISRQSIGSYGAGGTINGRDFSQTIGQPYSTVVYNDADILINPGFQQSSYFGILKNAQNDLEDKKSLNEDYHNLKIYPNPAHDKIHIVTEFERGFLQVVNMQGKRILRKKISSVSSASINCSDWISGPYIILLFDESTDTHYTTKILISK